MRKRNLALLMAAAMTAAAVTGCGGSKPAETAPAPAENAEGEAAAAPEDFSYPMAEGDTLQY